MSRSTIQIGNTKINPTYNPAILDTATWNPASVWQRIQVLDDSYWQSVEDAIDQKRTIPIKDHFIPFIGSSARQHGNAFFLAMLDDNQHALIRVGTHGNSPVLGEPIKTKSITPSKCIAAYSTEASIISEYLEYIKPAKAPRPLGAISRLGIGTRMTTAVWPGIWRAMQRSDFAANAIQNSLRELNLLEDLRAGARPKTNYMYNFGELE